MNAEQLEPLVEGALPNVRASIMSIEDKVLRAAADALEASQDADAGGKPILIITVAIKVPLTIRPLCTRTKAKVTGCRLTASTTDPLRTPSPISSTKSCDSPERVNSCG